MFEQRVQRWFWLAFTAASAAVFFASTLLFASSFGAELGNVASWASAIAGVAAVGFAASEVSRAEKRAAQDRLEAGRRVTYERQHSDKLARKQQRDAEKRWEIDRLLELLEAWDLYQAAPPGGGVLMQVPAVESRRVARARARALISALPGHFATIAGKELGVPRIDAAKVTQVLVVEDLAEVLGRAGAGRLEIEWNLQLVQGTYQADSAFQYIMERYTEIKAERGEEV